MAKEIKFRVIVAKKIFGYERLNDCGRWESMVPELNSDKGERWTPVIIDIVNAKRDQFTGLKDKKGREVYNNDRVRIRRHLQDGKHYIDVNCDVKFGRYCYCLFVADKQMWPLDPIVAREVEIIGNIYESPKN